MITGFNGSSQDMQFNANLHETISPGRAILLFISPRQNMVNHYHRPLKFNFTHNVANAIAERIAGNKPSVNPVDSILSGCPEINQAILPSSQGGGFAMNTSSFNQNWWFALMVDSNTNGIISNKLATRNIYIGICAQEPIGNRGMNSMTPEALLNPNCQLVITRSITMRKHTTLGAFGSTEQVRTTGNFELVNFDESIFPNSVLAQDNFYTMLPGTVKQNVVFGDGPEPDGQSVLNVSDSLNSVRKEVLPGELESPRMYTKNILRAFETGSMIFNSGTDMGGFGIDSLDDHFCDNSVKFESCVNHALSQDRRLSMMDDGSNNLANQNYLTIAMVTAMYAPKVQVVETSSPMMMDIIPQEITSPSNILSTIVCATIPTYLIQLGLSAVGFMYNSYQNATRLEHIESSVQCSQEHLQQKWKSFEALLRLDLYPILHSNGGDFDLQVMSNLNGSTDCILNLLDFSPLAPGSFYREDTSLGGMISPMVGTGQQLIENSFQLNHLVRNIGDFVSSNIPLNY